MSGRKSKEKGKRGERELAKVLSKLWGVEAKRGQQYTGSPDSPDVIAIPGIHIECKRTEKFELDKFLSQAINDAGENVPVVMYRRNWGDWILVLKLQDLPGLCDKIASVTTDNQ